MVSLDQINTSSFEERTIVFPAVFAKAINRLNQSELEQKSLNQAISKKIEPSLNDREEKIWAQWKNLLKDSDIS